VLDAGPQLGVADGGEDEVVEQVGAQIELLELVVAHDHDQRLEGEVPLAQVTGQAEGVVGPAVGPDDGAGPAVLGLVGVDPRGGTHRTPGEARGVEGLGQVGRTGIGEDEERLHGPLTRPAGSRRARTA
jgi:hypothetical protein